MTSHSSLLESRKHDAAKVADFLTKANDSMQELHARTESIHGSGNLEILGFSRQQLKALGGMLARGSCALRRRIAELKGETTVDIADLDYTFSRNAIMEPIAFFGSYRACCRALCAAMKEAMRGSDSISVLLVRDLVLRLEKQLWVIDAPYQNRGVDDSRAVALFLSC